MLHKTMTNRNKNAFKKKTVKSFRLMEHSLEINHS